MMHHDIPTMQFCVDPPNSNLQSPPGSIHEAITFSHESLSLLLILSTVIIDPPPGSTHEVIAFSCESLSLLLILSTAIVNPPQDQHMRQSPFHMKV